MVTVMVTLYLKRGGDDWAKKAGGGGVGGDGLEFRGVSPHYGGVDGAGHHGIVHTHTAGTLPLFNTFATHKTYIDPHTYEDPHQVTHTLSIYPSNHLSTYISILVDLSVYLKIHNKTFDKITPTVYGRWA